MTRTPGPSIYLLVAGSVLIIAAFLGVVVLIVDHNGPLGITLSMAITSCGFCGVLALMLLNWKRCTASAIAFFTHIPAWHGRVSRISGAVTCVIVPQLLCSVLRESCGLETGAATRWPLAMATAAFVVGTQLVQASVLQRFWRRDTQHARCAACGQIGRAHV